MRKQSPSAKEARLDFAGLEDAGTETLRVDRGVAAQAHTVAAILDARKDAANTLEEFRFPV